MADRERTFHATISDKNVRPLENNYSIDQLALILQLWCKDHQQDLVLGCLMSIGLLNLYDNDNATADTGIVWIYSSNTGRATADEYTDHDEALRSPTVPSSPDSKTFRIYSLRALDFSLSTSVAESSANRCHSRLSLDLQPPSGQPMYQTFTYLGASTEDGADEPEGSYGAAVVVVSPPPGGQPATLPTATAFETGATLDCQSLDSLALPAAPRECHNLRRTALGHRYAQRSLPPLSNAVSPQSYAGNALILLGAHDEDSEEDHRTQCHFHPRKPNHPRNRLRSRRIPGNGDHLLASFCEPGCPRQANSQH
ncbi:hypothetical protein GE21DRAFT_1309588 [Neurospora crassa]|nr:hypothetical protein GE21DRAFT_1309588 [Neurospora crassa]